MILYWNKRNKIYTEEKRKKVAKKRFRKGEKSDKAKEGQKKQGNVTLFRNIQNTGIWNYFALGSRRDPIYWLVLNHFNNNVKLFDFRRTSVKLNLLVQCHSKLSLLYSTFIYHQETIYCHNIHYRYLQHIVYIQCIQYTKYICAFYIL